MLIFKIWTNVELTLINFCGKNDQLVVYKHSTSCKAPPRNEVDDNADWYFPSIPVPWVLYADETTTKSNMAQSLITFLQINFLASNKYHLKTWHFTFGYIWHVYRIISVSLKCVGDG